jgi:hypothetical protein
VRELAPRRSIRSPIDPITTSATIPIALGSAYSRPDAVAVKPRPFSKYDGSQVNTTAASAPCAK